MVSRRAVSAWLAATRPKTLPAAVAPVLVGAAEAYRLGHMALIPLAICLVFALLTQIGTNMSNDYFDCVRGADANDRIGPERQVSSGRIAPRAMLVGSIAVYGFAFCLGLTLVWYRGWELLVVGVVSLWMGFSYTGGPFPLAYHGLGDVFVIFFFGLVATGGTFYVLSGEVTSMAAVEGLALGLLANNILVVNNLRDRETDARAGKRTLIVRFGRPFGVMLYRIQFLVAMASLFYICWETASYWTALPMAAGPLGLMACRAVGEWDGEELNPLLGKSAGVLMLFGGSLAFGLTMSG